MRFAYENVLVVGNAAITHKVAVLVRSFGIPVFGYIYEKNTLNIFSIKELFDKDGIPCSLGGEDGLRNLIFALSEKPLLILSVVNEYLFPGDIVFHKNITIINKHNSILPKHAGMHPVAWQIFEMDENVGTTWHYVTNKIDDGDIIAQESIRNDNTFTSIRLLRLLNNLAYNIFSKICESVLQGVCEATPQVIPVDHKARPGKERPNNGYLDIKWEFAKISSFLRAMDFGKLKTLGNGRVILGANEYNWKRYTIDESANVSDDCFIRDNNIVIQKGAIGGGRITLKNCNIAT